MTEEWRDIQGYEGLYQVSNLGRVKSLAREMSESHKGTPYTRHYPERILSEGNDGAGYKLCWLSKNGKGKSIRVHRLVALAFIPNPNNLRYVNHRDENKANNNVENLEWCTPVYNANYGTAIERRVNVQIPKQNKSVYQLDMDGNVLEVFPSVKEASRITGVNNISAAARGLLKHSKGYKWMYVT